MKLIPTTGKYISPLSHQGTFENAYIEDREIILKRNENYLAVIFVLAYIRDEKEVILYQKKIEFIGLDSDYKNSTNQTSFFKYPNPSFDPDFIPDENSTPEDLLKTIEIFEKIPLINYLNNNAGVLPDGAEITDYGYPTYEAVLNYFTGGTLSAPEINITDPIARGFFLNKVMMNGEPCGVQFQFTD